MKSHRISSFLCKSLGDNFVWGNEDDPRVQNWQSEYFRKTWWLLLAGRWHKHEECWGRERAGPLRYFNILVTSLFQCALHTPRSPMQSQDWASQGKTWLLHRWQLYQKCPPLHFKIYLAILYSCFWGWKIFQFFYEIETKMVFFDKKMKISRIW